VIDYIRHGRPEAGCAQVFVKHRYPFTAFGSSSSAGCRLRILGQFVRVIEAVSLLTGTYLHLDCYNSVP